MRPPGSEGLRNHAKVCDKDPRVANSGGTSDNCVVTSRSARITSERPFYDLHADAYDALITDPVQPWVEAVHARLIGAGVRSASILDAGCGTGRHAAALAGLGHRVTLMDASASLLAIAARRCPDSRVILADICAPAMEEEFDAVTCRGVLNDLVEDQERDDALGSLAALVAGGGMLVVDIRDADASRQRAYGTWRTTEVALVDGARLRFSSRPSWRAGLIVVEERYEILDGADPVSPPREYIFQMRPWTHAEVKARLDKAGFKRIEIEPGVGRRTADRLLVTARR